MSLVLKDLINSNFKNLQQDLKGNMIYTLLPIVDELENEKIRLSLVLYYTALYYDNVDLLHELLKADVRFEYNCYIALQYLDKTISSKFETKDYVEKVKIFGYIFKNFVKSIENLSEEQREIYSKRFATLFNLKYQDVCDATKEYRGYPVEPLGKLFVKNSLDTFDDNAYRNADNKQLELIDFCGSITHNKETCARLNNLISCTNFSNQLCDFDLMMKLYTDEELETLEYDVSYCLSHFSDTEEMLKKAIDFVKLRPNLAFVIVACVSKERFMKTSNHVLIEVMNYMSIHRLMRCEENIKRLSKTMIPKAMLKKALGGYKRG